eukprot:8681927-Pyramimonas_sp.AAC.1
MMGKWGCFLGGPRGEIRGMVQLLESYGGGEGAVGERLGGHGLMLRHQHAWRAGGEIGKISDGGADLRLEVGSK